MIKLVGWKILDNFFASSQGFVGGLIGFIHANLMLASAFTLDCSILLDQLLELSTLDSSSYTQ
jgi:hypothetical protein